MCSKNTSPPHSFQRENWPWITRGLQEYIRYKKCNHTAYELRNKHEQDNIKNFWINKMTTLPSDKAVQI